MHAHSIAFPEVAFPAIVRVSTSPGPHDLDLSLTSPMDRPSCLLDSLEWFFLQSVKRRSAFVSYTKCDAFKTLQLLVLLKTFCMFI